MVILNFSGLDMFLVGELNKKIHSQIANAYGVEDEDVIFQAADSFIFYKGVEQTSFNLLVKIDAPEELVDCEELVVGILLEACKEYSVHTRVLFSYYDPNHYYEKINNDYPEYIDESPEIELNESEYDEESDYSEDDLYTGNMFEDLDNDDEPVSLNDLINRRK